MYMYVYVCICMYMYVYVCICLYMYVYVSIVYMLCSPMLEEIKNLSIYLSISTRVLNKYDSQTRDFAFVQVLP